MSEEVTTTTAASPASTTQASDKVRRLKSLREQGYVVLRSLVPQDLLPRLQAVSQHVTDLARSGTWPYVRTVPKQYPPWTLNRPGTNIWGVQHLLHPDMPHRDVFATIYFSSFILDVVMDLIDSSSGSGLANPLNAAVDKDSDSLVMELFNLLVSPGESTDFELCWHRDDIKPDISPEEEQKQLASKSPGGCQLHAQYNIALTHDASLIVVPGSHRRVRTEVERHAGPFETDIPGQIVVELHPGDVVFYDSNILHRGAYKGINAKKESGRLTLHGSVGLAGYGDERARQVLQHGVGQWVHGDQAEFQLGEEVLQVRAEAMRQRLIAMGTGEGLGYSLDG